VLRSLVLTAAAATAVAVPAVASAASPAPTPKPVPTPKPAPTPPPTDAFAADGKTAFFTFAALGATTGKGTVEAPNVADGVFAFKFTSGLQVAGRITCVRAEGGNATAGGVITSSKNGADLDGLADKGQSIEFSLLDNKTGKDAVSSLSFIGAGPADCVTDYDTDSPLPAGHVIVSDRYTPPVAPETPAS
jgi:hypothetical protein